MKYGRTGDPGQGKIVDLGLPHLLAGGGIHGISEGAGIAEKGGVTRPGHIFHGSDSDRGPDAGAGIEIPVDAAGGRVERVHFAPRAAYEHAPSHDGGVRIGALIAGKAESPFHFQARHLGRRQSGCGGVLKTRVGGIDAPSVPDRSRQRISKRTLLRGAHGCRRWSGLQFAAQLLPGDEFGQNAPIGSRMPAGHGNHGAGFHGVQYAVGSHSAEGLTARSAVEAAIMAGGAGLLVEGRAVLRPDQAGRE